jgi:hypothetical protein
MSYVPVVERGATEAVTGFWLTFVAVTNMTDVWPIRGAGRW